MKRKKPENVPEEAVWDQKEQRWGLGRRERGVKVGTWRYFWENDGSLAGLVEYDERGRWHGKAEWFHPSGDLWRQGTYVNGKLHGKSVCAMARRGHSPGSVNFDGLPSSVRQVEMPCVRGKPQTKHSTLYNSAGRGAPIAVDARQGRAIGLGEQLKKLVSGTTLAMVEPYATTVSGEAIERPKATHFVLVKAGPKRVTLRSRPDHDDGPARSPDPDLDEATDHVFDPAELSRAFTLSTDYFHIAAAREEEVRAAEAAEKITRLEKVKAIDGLLEGNALERLFRAWTPLVPSTSPREILSRSEAFYGARFPVELRSLVRLHEGFELPCCGDFRPFFFEEPFFADFDPEIPEAAAATQLCWSRQMYLTIGLHAHFLGLFPIGASAAGDYWLCDIRPTGVDHARVYFFDHEELTLMLAYYSVSELVYRNTFQRGTGFLDIDGWRSVGTDTLCRQFRKRAKSARRPRSEDPVWLFKRGEWLMPILAGRATDELAFALVDAPSFAVWRKERRLCSTHPHIALYWLAAHWLLGNHRAFAATLEETRQSPNTFVRSLGALLQKADSDGVDPLGMGRAITQLREEADDRLFGRTERKRRRDARMHTEAAAAAVVQDAITEGMDLLDLMASHPDDLELHRRALSVLAEGDEALSKNVSRYNVIVSGQGTHAVGVELAARADSRLLVPLAALVRRGYKVDRHHPNAASELIAALGRLGGALSLDTLMEGFGKGLDLDRIEKIVLALGSFDDPRVEERCIHALNSLLEYEQQVLDGPGLFVTALGVLVERHPEAAREFCLRTLREAKRDEWLIAAANHARQEMWHEASELLCAVIEANAIGDNRVTGAASGALAALDPARAVGLLGAQWERVVEAGGEPAEPRALAIGRFASLLAGLLPLWPDEPRYLDSARFVLGYRGVHESLLTAVRHVLDGLTSRARPDFADAIRPHLLAGLGRGDDYPASPESAAVRRAAALALAAAGVEVPKPRAYCQSELKGMSRDELLSALVDPVGLGKENVIDALLPFDEPDVAKVCGELLVAETNRLYLHEDAHPLHTALIAILGQLRDYAEPWLDAIVQNADTAAWLRREAHAALEGQ